MKIPSSKHGIIEIHTNDTFMDIVCLYEKLLSFQLYHMILNLFSGRHVTQIKFILCALAGPS
jgi:hypothetical protein